MKMAGSGINNSNQMVNRNLKMQKDVVRRNTCSE